MEELAKAPLNKAHILDRSAESYARKQLFEKAIQCREQAIECLLTAKQPHLMEESVQSLNDQISSHQHRIRLLKEMHHAKRARVSLSKKNSSPLRNPLSEASNETTTKPIADSTTSSALEAAIRNEISKGDKLLETLVSQKSPVPSENDTPHGKNDTLITSAIKLPKPAEQVLEELQLHNSQLKSLVFGLLEEVEALKEENGRLRVTVAQLETARDSLDGHPVRNSPVPPHITPEKSKSTDSFSSSQSTELPPLEPFEMPQIPAGFKPRIKIAPRKSRTSE